MMTELDTTSIGVLTTREYRKTATVRAVKAETRKFGMIREWTGNRLRRTNDRDWYLTTLEGELYMDLGSESFYICKSIDGEVWPVRADIFEKTYEEVV